MDEMPWGWKVTTNTIDTFEMTREVDEDPSKISISFVQGHPVMNTSGTFCELKAIEFALARWPAAERKPRYLQLLEGWRADGSFDRIKKAVEDRTEVRIKRSSGAWQPCVLTTAAGLGGLMSSVEWEDAGAPDGKLFKQVRTEDLLDWNPELRGETLADVSRKIGVQHKLTTIEQDVFDGVVRGWGSQKIGSETGLGRRAIKWHMHNIFMKTGTQGREDLLRLALTARTRSGAEVDSGS